MISVYIFKEKNFRSLKMEGHAGYNPGNDVVCSAASMLTCVLKGYIERNLHDAENALLDAEKGCANISFSGDTETLAVFDAVELGFCMLALRFPEYVKVSQKFF